MFLSFGFLSVIFIPALSRCTQIKTYSWDNAQVVLVGNKCDLEDERVVSTERGRQLADQLGTYHPSISMAVDSLNYNGNCDFLCAAQIMNRGTLMRLFHLVAFHDTCDFF